MKKTLIILGIIVLGLIVYFTAAIDTGIQPPPNGKQPLKTGKAPVIASITPSKTSSCCVNIKGEGFLTDEATNEVIWTHKEKGFKIWGGGWISRDKKTLKEVQIPVWSGKYDVFVRNRNGVSDTFSYTVDWNGFKDFLGAYVTDFQPANPKPGRKVIVETVFGFGDIKIWKMPLPLGDVRYTDRKENGNLVSKTEKGFLILGFDPIPLNTSINKQGEDPIQPDFVIPGTSTTIKSISDNKIEFKLPEGLKENTEYLIKFDTLDITPDSFIIIKTGK